MTTAQTICPEMRFVRRGTLGRTSAEPSLLSLLQTLFVRVGGYFESYDDYFAEVERSLPLHVREERRNRRQSNRLLLIATLGR
jgi:hypothetical protein